MPELKEYQCHKQVHARPMTRGDYNAYRDWDMPADEDHSEEGYLVVYNRGTEDHYESWSPKFVFDKGYNECPLEITETNPDETSGVPFGLAIEALKKGKKVARAGWNGKGMFLFLVSGSTFKVNRAPLLGIYPEGTEINYCPHIDMKTADDKVVPWLASQTDVLADDWSIID